LLANRITNVPGASNVFVAGYIVYRTNAEVDVSRVDSELIAQNGAVSEPVAVAMAEGARKRSRTDFALATTGIAGPGGGQSRSRSGPFLWRSRPPIATLLQAIVLPNDRETFKQQTAQAAFDMLRRQLSS